MDTTTIAPLTRREAREIERQTGRRPVAGAVAPTELTLTAAVDVPMNFVEDTSRIERNDVADLVSVVPTEIIDRIAGPSLVKAEVEQTDVADIPEAFRGRAVSVRAARPASLVARARRRRATGLAIAASAAALATAGAVLPGALGGVSEQNSSAASLASAAEAAQAPVVDADVPETVAPVADLVAAPEQAAGDASFVVSFSADEVSEAVPTTSSSSGEVSTGSSTEGGTSNAGGGGGYGAGYGEGVISTAASMVGSGSGWTCDKFVREVFAANGISVGVGVSGIASQATFITSDESQAQPGDLLVWPGEHIGIAAGGGMMYDNPGDGRENKYRAIWGDPDVYRL